MSSSNSMWFSSTPLLCPVSARFQTISMYICRFVSCDAPRVSFELVYSGIYVHTNSSRVQG